MTIVDELVSDLYRRRDSTWRQACQTAVAFLDQATTATDPDNKYGYSIHHRIKEASRATAKVNRKLKEGAPAFQSADIEEIISDWIGVKVTCNTTDDAKALISKLGMLCTTAGNPRFATKDGQDDVVDYMKSPKASGYRGYHAVILVNAHENAEPCEVKVEIQIKTRLQDAWGELTHESFYKSEDVDPSPFHTTLARTMADLLDVVDRYANDLATEVAASSTSAHLSADEDTSATAGHISHDSSAASSATVTVKHVEPTYALAVDPDGETGLIRAVTVRDLLAQAGKVEPDQYISVDDELTVGQMLTATREHANGKTFFIPESLDSPR
ncbi:GTP pyrophosphokinase [Mycobacteroides abscessus]|uniref:GTP pyrophosphokinase n=1 Tax=Mycobacteroides abscessus TaxID=36809 RepID=UPI000C2674F7|nr:RelA/SpoT protein [Mycobacteroides abscessus]